MTCENFITGDKYMTGDRKYPSSIGNAIRLFVDMYRGAKISTTTGDISKLVEIIEESDPWAKVRTPGGTEGWMLRRYLSSDPPPSEMVDILQTRNEELEKKEEETSRRYDELATAYSQMEQEYNACIADRENIKNKYIEYYPAITSILNIP